MADPTSLAAWRAANRLAEQVYKNSTDQWAPWSGSAWEQARRAALSVSLNLVEGYAWAPGSKWRYHLRVANGSALEALYAIRFLGRIGAIDPGRAEELVVLAEESKRKVWALLKSQMP